MDITNEKYNEILERGLTLDHYLVMYNIKYGVAIVKNKRAEGFINLLIKKGYISEGGLTEKGIEIVDTAPPVTIEVVKEEEEKKFDVVKWAGGVHSRLQNKIFALTGNMQVKSKLGLRMYPFFPNVIDLTKNLHKVILIYKLKDYDKIERCLTRHIEQCHKNGEWFPLLNYYITKDNRSQMVTDMETMDLEEKEKSDEQFTIIKNKDLFE